ncbi:hypothetical protein CLV58_103290 [Spirosoma oryzae]|uniref:DUF3575 domain-containing protein n=1 Tax=Spirosoma oryzae TaxID=1469603 RepID=A0A2T0TF80_9BACT|nr:DUF3575 domain-containing protein [Spirosoma oryzae]PRY44320.1 hypothetical protein CLV58_103290 [Spirosoma oryzae]
MIHRILVAGLLLSGAVRAQVNPTVPGPTRSWVLKVAPLSLLDLSSTIQAAVEGVVAPNQSVQLELGYGWQAMNPWLAPNQERYSRYEVWRGRAEWRYYWRGGQAPFGTYTAIEGLYKRENALEKAVTAVYDEPGPVQYYRQSSLPISKDVFGINVKIGRQFPLLPNGRLVFDIYTGLGLRARTILRTDLPNGYQLTRQPIVDIGPFTTYGGASLFSLSAGFKIGYAL